MFTKSLLFQLTMILNQFWFSPSALPAVIGPVKSNDFSSNNWTQEGSNTTWTFNQNNIQVVGTAGQFTPLIRYNKWFSVSEEFTMKAVYSVDVLNTVFLGVGIRTKSTYSGGVDFYAYMSTANADAGAIYIYRDTDIIVQDTVNVVSFNQGDDIEVTLTNSASVFTATFRNVTQNGSTRTISYTTANPYLYPLAIRLPTIFQPAFQCARGTYTIKNWSFSLNNYNYIDLLLIGDSKTEGYYSGTFALRNAGLWASNNSYKIVQVSAASGSVTQDILNIMPEILRQYPKKVILCIGRNDLGNNVPSGTWQTNYASIVSQLQSQAVDVYHQLPLTETVLDQSSLTTYINSNYPANKIISVPGTWNAATDTPDGIHPNVTGFGKIYTNQALTITL